MDWLYSTDPYIFLSTLLAVAGVICLAFGVLGKRPKDGPRCLRCGYPMAQEPWHTCPACEWKARMKADLTRPRRSRRLIAMGVLLGLLILPTAYMRMANTRVMDDDEDLLEALTPTTWYVLQYPWLSNDGMQRLSQRASGYEPVKSTGGGSSIGLFSSANAADEPAWDEDLTESYPYLSMEPSLKVAGWQARLLVWSTPASLGAAPADAHTAQAIWWLIPAHQKRLITTGEFDRQFQTLTEPQRLLLVKSACVHKHVPEPLARYYFLNDSETPRPLFQLREAEQDLTQAAAHADNLEDLTLLLVRLLKTHAVENLAADAMQTWRKRGDYPQVLIDTLVKQLDDPSVETWSYAAWHLSRLGPQVRPQVEAALNHPNPAVAAWARITLERWDRESNTPQPAPASQP